MNSSMRVLALDPGYDRLGAAIIEKSIDGEKLLHSTCITTDKSADLSARLFVIGTAVDELLAKYQPDTVALETIFFNKNAKTAIGVAEARGICIYVGKKYGCAIVEYSPQQVKVATTGYGNSDKISVINMVKRLIHNAPESAHDDEYDAIAVGITALAHARQQ